MSKPEIQIVERSQANGDLYNGLVIEKMRGEYNEKLSQAIEVIEIEDSKGTAVVDGARKDVIRSDAKITVTDEKYLGQVRGLLEAHGYSGIKTSGLTITIPAVTDVIHTGGVAAGASEIRFNTTTGEVGSARSVSGGSATGGKLQFDRESLPNLMNALSTTVETKESIHGAAIERDDALRVITQDIQKRGVSASRAGLAKVSPHFLNQNDFGPNGIQAEPSLSKITILDGPVESIIAGADRELGVVSDVTFRDSTQAGIVQKALREKGIQSRMIGTGSGARLQTDVPLAKVTSALGEAGLISPAIADEVRVLEAEHKSLTQASLSPAQMETSDNARPMQQQQETGSKPMLQQQQQNGRGVGSAQDEAKIAAQRETQIARQMAQLRANQAAAAKSAATPAEPIRPVPDFIGKRTPEPHQSGGIITRDDSELAAKQQAQLAAQQALLDGAQAQGATPAPSEQPTTVRTGNTPLELQQQQMKQSSNSIPTELAHNGHTWTLGVGEDGKPAFVLSIEPRDFSDQWDRLIPLWDANIDARLTGNSDLSNAQLEFPATAENAARFGAIIPRVPGEVSPRTVYYESWSGGYGNQRMLEAGTPEKAAQITRVLQESGIDAKLTHNTQIGTLRWDAPPTTGQPTRRLVADPAIIREVSEVLQANGIAIRSAGSEYLNPFRTYGSSDQGIVRHAYYPNPETRAQVQKILQRQGIEAFIYGDDSIAFLDNEANSKALQKLEGTRVGPPDVIEFDDTPEHRAAFDRIQETGIGERSIITFTRTDDNVNKFNAMRGVTNASSSGTSMKSGLDGPQAGGKVTSPASPADGGGTAIDGNPQQPMQQAVTTERMPTAPTAQSDGIYRPGDAEKYTPDSARGKGGFASDKVQAGALPDGGMNPAKSHLTAADGAATKEPRQSRADIEDPRLRTIASEAAAADVRNPYGLEQDRAPQILAEPGAARRGGASTASLAVPAPESTTAELRVGQGTVEQLRPTSQLRPEVAEVIPADRNASVDRVINRDAGSVLPVAANDAGVSALQANTTSQTAPTAPANDVEQPTKSARRKPTVIIEQTAAGVAADASPAGKVAGGSQALDEAARAEAAITRAAASNGAVDAAQAALHAYNELGHVGRMGALLRRGAQKIPVAGVALAGGFAVYALYNAEVAYQAGELIETHIKAVRAALAPYVIGQAGSFVTGLASEEVIDAGLAAAGVPEKYRLGTLRQAIASGAQAAMDAHEFSKRKEAIPHPTVSAFIEALRDKSGTTQDEALNDYFKARDEALAKAKWGEDMGAKVGRVPYSQDRVDSDIYDAARTYLAYGGNIDTAMAALSDDPARARLEGQIQDVINLAPLRVTKAGVYPSNSDHLETLRDLKSQREAETDPTKRDALMSQMQTEAANYLGQGKDARDALFAYYRGAPFGVSTQTVEQMQANSDMLHAFDGADGSKRDGKISMTEIGQKLVNMGVYTTRIDANRDGEADFKELQAVYRNPEAFKDRSR